MLESPQAFVSYLVANEWALRLTCFVYCLVSVAIIGITKKVISVVFHKKTEKVFDGAKFEYPFAVGSFVVAFGIIFGFLFVHTDKTIWQVVASSGASAFMTQGAYHLLCQPTRKVFEKLWKLIVKLYGKIKTKTITVKDVTDGLAELTEGETEVSPVDHFIKSIQNK